MAIKSRDRTGAGGGSTPAPVRRRIVVHTSAPQPKNATLDGELGQVVRELRNTRSAGVVRHGHERPVNYGRLRSGILSIDLALGGGLMLSRGAMLCGEKSSGKSTLALIFCGMMQRAYPDLYPVWMDIEGTWDEKWAARFMDPSRILIVEPETGEEAVDIADAVMRANESSLIVTDSIAMLVPMKELEASAEDSLPGVHARLTGNYIRRVNNALLNERHRGHTPIVLHINQFRMKIGVMFGDPRTMPGGKALEFSTSQQMELHNKEHRNDKTNIVMFNEHTVKITKDKTGGRIKEAKFKLIRDESAGLPVGYIDQTKTILDFGSQTGIIQATGGAHYVIDGHKLHGEDRVREFFRSDPERCYRIQTEIVEHFRNLWGVV